jgi:hypothetical protein
MGSYGDGGDCDNGCDDDDNDNDDEDGADGAGNTDGGDDGNDDDDDEDDDDDNGIEAGDDDADDAVPKRCFSINLSAYSLSEKGLSSFTAIDPRFTFNTEVISCLRDSFAACPSPNSS